MLEKYALLCGMLVTKPDDCLDSSKASHTILAESTVPRANIKRSVRNQEKSRSLLRKKNSRMMLESIENGPLVYSTIEENGQNLNKKYAELTEQEQLQDDYDVQATNIVNWDS
ncbi:hypothetical protein Tco_0721911 [Tanacetum coccineum]